QYTFGPAGNRTRVVEDAGRTIDFSYDSLFRLTRETITEAGGTSATVSYGYDAIGNRISRSGPAGSITASFDANGRMLHSGTETFAYDAAGNLLTRNGPAGLTSYQYDGLNQLVSAVSPTGQTQYAFNAMGHQVQKTDASGTTHYLVDPFGADNLSQVLREAGPSSTVEYVRAGNTLLSAQRAGGTSYYLHDGRMSTRLLADAAGSVTDRYDYDAFGNVLARSGATPNEYLFAGQQLDAALRLYDLRARYYDPNAGRFTSRDPHPGQIFDPGSLHPYTYAHNDPVNRSDPSGLFTLLETMQYSAGVGILAGTAYSLENYYYYRSAELAFEVGVDAFFSYGSLTMDAIGAGALFRQVGSAIVRGVGSALANRTIINQTARNAGKTIETQLDDILQNVACRTNNPRRCGGLVVRTLQQGADDIAAAERAAAEAAEAAERKAREYALSIPGFVERSTVTQRELNGTVPAIGEGFKAAVNKLFRSLWRRQ
ncbi:MAG TPA: RHS repeat-associated core domain-containing protein, partial [Vicinamibacterales bacterium]